MRVIFVFIAVIFVLVWLGFEIRPRNRPASNVLYAFAVLFLVLLAGAFYGWY